MNQKQLSLSVIIPAYNEEARIGKTVSSIDRFLNQRPDGYEIVVVDDGSSDQTQRIVRDLSERIPEIRLIAHAKNHGKGWAVRSGMLNARGAFRLFMDADGSTSINHWIGLRDSIEMGADVAVGSRHAHGAVIQKRQSLHRVVLGFVFRELVRMLFRFEIHDTQNGFKAFTAEAAQRIFKRQTVKGWAFDVEVLAIAKRLGYSIVEIPIVWIDDERSKVKALSMPKMLLDILRIRSATKRRADIVDPQWDRVVFPARR